MSNKLTAKQKKFIDEYLIDLNATQAAIRAGYSNKTANRIATENLSKPYIQAEIQKRQAEIQKSTDITREKVLNELSSIAFAKPTDMVNVIKIKTTDDDNNPIVINDVTIKPTADLDDHQKAAISSIKMGRNGIEVRYNDKLRALDQISKILGLYQEDKDDNVNITINHNIPRGDSNGD